MIITGIEAENLLKYARISLSDLPRSGVIAISGQNESGKSTIGEVICFGLLGRTFSFEAKQLGRIIRWGEIRCSVAMTFSTGGDAEYRISRYLDNDGNHSARLEQVGEEEPLAVGVDHVAAAMTRLLGYDFDEYIESFYLAQREITTPQPHSQAVKTMAGLTALETACGEFGREIDLEQEVIADAEAERAGIDGELAELDLREEQLQILDEERKPLAEEQAEIDRLSGELDGAGKRYEEDLPRLRSARRNRIISGGMTLLMLTGVVVGAAVPEAAEGEGGFPWTAAMVLCGLFFLLCLGSLAILKGRIDGLVKSAENLAAMLEILSRGQGCGGETDVEAETAFTLDRTLILRVAESDADPEEVRGTVAGALEFLERQSLSRRERINLLDRAIEVERERIRKAEKLKQTREGVEERIGTHRHRISVRELAMELLTGAENHLSQRFNRDLRDLVGRTLPLFTEGRYEHLKIDDALNVQVFSSEKRDFVQLEEVSSGTQRQIMLAVRLSLSQQLVDSVVKGNQFVFLDEPFAFFDQERTSHSLAVLPRLSDEITQVWIVAQAFPPEVEFARHLQCRREYEELMDAVPA